MGVLRVFKGFSSLSSIRAKIKSCPTRWFSQSRSISSFKVLDPTPTEDPTLPVLIAGAGPVGLVLALLLTKLGIKCTILERSNAFTEHPRAHFINNRSMEIFRKLDGLADEIQKSQPPVDFWRKFIYCTSLTGPILGSVDHMQPQDFEKVVSPVSVAHFSQHKLTRLLVRQLESLKFRVCSTGLECPNSEQLNGGKILMGHECISIDATDECINTTISFLHEGEYVQRKIPCKILVGSDGAGSTIRKLVGIKLRGERELQNLVSVHFKSQDLGSVLISERPGMLFFIFNTEAIGVLVAHDLDRGEFVLQIPFYPPQQSLHDFNPEMCKELILKLVGRELSDVNVMDIKPWVMHAEVAERFSCFDNRILLAGDAAHRFPPAGGFGMNTGIQDAHNLAWKIASFLKGIAPVSILGTYEAERRPIALFNTSLSVQNFKAAMAVPAALGLDPTVANSVHRLINSGVGSILPSGIQKAVLDGVFSLGRFQISNYLLNEKNPLGLSRLSKLRLIFEEGKSLQLQFPAEDLGFRYLKGALIPETDDAVDHGAPTGRRRDYVPSTAPGSRLPHMNVKVLSDLNKEEIISTLDLISGDRIEFLLMITPVEESYDLALAAFEVARTFEVSLRVCILWPAITGLGQGSKAVLGPWKNYVDVMEVKRASEPVSWWTACNMTDKGAILVRPDEHIAWCARTGTTGDLVSAMERVFSTVLGTNSANIPVNLVEASCGPVIRRT